MNDAQAQKVDAEIARLIAETAKINSAARFHPLIIIVGLVVAFGTMLKLFAA